MKHLGTKRIETDRLILRRFTLDDAAAMYRNWASDPEVTKFLMWPTHSSVEVTKEVLADWIAAYENDDKYEWCIAKKENDEPIGSMGVVKTNEKIKCMEIGYCISRDYWNQGITSEALKAVMAYLLEEVGVERIESRHDPKNPHSGAVMRKCGLRYEGTRVRADWNNSGICDVAMYGYVKGVTEAQMTADGKGIQQAEAAAVQQSGQTVATVQQNSQSAVAIQQSNQSTVTVEQASIAPVKVADDKTPKNEISDETIEYVGILAKLELSDEEKEHAKKDMGEMLDYIDKLNELDTTGVEPMSHVFPVNNVFREDVVTNGDGSVATLSNAPEKKDGGFKVPKTIA